MKNILITGSAGGIGSAISELYLKEGYAVIGLDVQESHIINKNYHHINCDISNPDDLNKLQNEMKLIIGTSTIEHIICTSAIQALNDHSNISEKKLLKSLSINAIAQFKIFNLLKELLVENKSSFLSINSIHSTLTKKGFISYSSSKKLLEGLMDGLSLEFDLHRIKIIQIFPAAIETSMLRDGLSEESFKKIASSHPTKTIGLPKELAELIFKILSIDSSFMNGAKINFDGGISNLLHDPDLK